MKLIAALLVCCCVVVFASEGDKTPKAEVIAPDDNKRAICDRCKCDEKAKTIDCESLKLLTAFTAEQWMAVDNTSAALENVRLDNNVIRNVTVFPKLNIRVLNLSTNKIVTIERYAFRDLPRLEILDLSSNLLTFQSLRPEVFEGHYDPLNYEPLKALKSIDLSDNRLHALDADLFEHTPSVETLKLGKNPFVVIDLNTATAISSLAELKYLDLSYMELTTLPDHLLHAPRNLVHLDLTGNLMKVLPDALNYAINLEYLSMDENPMTNLEGDNVFPNLKKLETLSISYMMPLKKIGEKALSGLTGLTKLMCSNNPHLSEIHMNALSRPSADNNGTEEWPHVKELYIHNNNLSTLDNHLLGRWDNLKYIDIRINPWVCDCENQWLLDIVMPIVMNQTGFVSSQIICDHPIEMLGKELSVLKQSNSKMRCSDRYGNRPERDGRLLVGLLIGLLVGIPLSFIVLCIYRRGCFGLTDHFGYAGAGAADYSRAFYKRADMQDTDLRVHI